VCVLDELERRVTASILAAQLQRTLGAEVEVPDWYEIRGEFDASLVAPPVAQDPRTLVLRAMGLR